MSETFYPAGFVIGGKYDDKNVYKETIDSFMVVSGDTSDKLVIGGFSATNYSKLKSISRETVARCEEISSVNHGPNTGAIAKGAFWFGTAGALVAAATSKLSTYDVAFEFKDGDKFIVKFTVPGYYQEFKRIFYDCPRIIQDTQPSQADELMKFKKLLDQGVITQKEFDAKKKQLLGL